MGKVGAGVSRGGDGWARSPEGQEGATQVWHCTCNGLDGEIHGMGDDALGALDGANLLIQGWDCDVDGWEAKH